MHGDETGGEEGEQKPQKQKDDTFHATIGIGRDETTNAAIVT